MTHSLLSTVTLAGAYASALETASGHDRAQKPCTKDPISVQSPRWISLVNIFTRRLRTA